MKNGLLIMLLCHLSFVLCEIQEKQIADEGLLGLDQFDDRLSKGIYCKMKFFKGFFHLMIVFSFIGKNPNSSIKTR